MVGLTLVHSPLVGPSTWKSVAAVLVRMGGAAHVLDLTGAAAEGTAHAFVRTAARAIAGSDRQVLVGHSGAGLLVPWIAEMSDAEIAGFVFVDAHIPPQRGDVALADEELARLLDSMTIGGRLRPWSEWWGPEGMAQLVPDEELRAALTAEIPCLPRSYFDDHVRVRRAGRPGRAPTSG